MSTIPGRVDQVGSLLRPERLKDARMKHSRGEMDDAQLALVENDAVTELIKKEEQHGLPILTDGEYRRAVFMDSFSDVEGMDWRPVSEAFFSTQEDPTGGGQTGRRRPRVEAKGTLKLIRSRPLEEYKFASALTTHPVKVTIVGPERICRMAGFVSPGSRGPLAPEPSGEDVAYENEIRILPDIVRVLREMIQQLVDAGCKYIHMDESGYTSWVDPAVVESMRSRGHDPEARMTRLIAADNAIIAGFPKDVTFAIHLCRGNEGKRWHRQGSYEPIAERLFNELNHDRLLLEYDSERAGDFSPLRFVPTSKTAVLGLVTTKDGRVETKDELVRRLDEASKFISLDQVAISPQCGFSSSFQSGPVSEDEQWRKFDVLVETANQVWGE